MSEEFKKRDKRDTEIDREINIQVWKFKLSNFKKKTNF